MNPALEDMEMNALHMCFQDVYKFEVKTPVALRKAFFAPCCVYQLSQNVNVCD